MKGRCSKIHLFSYLLAVSQGVHHIFNGDKKEENSHFSVIKRAVGYDHVCWQSNHMNTGWKYSTATAKEVQWISLTLGFSFN